MVNTLEGQSTRSPEPEAPLITIGVTCYNAESTIGRALDSVVRQDWRNREVIVVDDASTDGSLGRIEHYAERHRDIRIVRHRNNRGYAGALNSIVENAKGEFIALFDDDDVSRSDRLSKQHVRLRSYEERHGTRLVLCYANRSVVRGGQREPSHIALAIGRESPEPHGSIVADYLFGHLADSKHVWGMFGSCTLMARRRTFLDVGGFDESFRRSAEWDFAVRAAFLSGHFIAVNEPLITQYKTATEDKMGVVPLRYAIQLRHKYRDYLKREGVYWASIAAAHSRFHGAKGRLWRSRLLGVLAYVLLPPQILAAKVRDRLARRSGAVR